MVGTTSDSSENELPELDIGDGKAPKKDEIILEVDVDDVEEEGNEEEERVSNDNMESNVAIEC